LHIVSEQPTRDGIHSVVRSPASPSQDESGYETFIPMLPRPCSGDVRDGLCDPMMLSESRFGKTTKCGPSCVSQSTHRRNHMSTTDVSYVRHGHCALNGTSNRRLSDYCAGNTNGQDRSPAPPSASRGFLVGAVRSGGPTNSSTASAPTLGTLLDGDTDARVSTQSGHVISSGPTDQHGRRWQHNQSGTALHRRPWQPNWKDGTSTQPLIRFSRSHCIDNVRPPLTYMSASMHLFVMHNASIRVCERLQNWPPRTHVFSLLNLYSYNLRIYIYINC
jgi:hypothetical protein